MTITFVLPYAGLQGGIRVIAIHAQRLAERGHQVMVVSTPQVFTLRQTLRSILVDREWPKPEPTYFNPATVEHRVLERVRPVTDRDVPDADVVVATYYTTAPGVLQLSPSKGAKAIFIQNYEVEPGRTNAALDETWRMPMHKITISRWLVDLARDEFGDPVVSHVPNSVDTTQFHAPPRNKGAVPTVGFLYNTFSLKGLDTTLEALRHVRAAIPDLHVVAFGAERLRRHKPLPRNATFHYRPPQKSLKDIYAQCDVWVCGSNREGFHLPPLEAMACRCPVVSTRVGGPLDTIVEGVNGHLVEVGNPVALADRVVRVLQLSNDDWKRMSEAAHRTATAFTWNESTRMFEEALELAIERYKRGELVPPAAAVLR